MTSPADIAAMVKRLNCHLRWCVSISESEECDCGIVLRAEAAAMLEALGLENEELATRVAGLKGRCEGYQMVIKQVEAEKAAQAAEIERLKEWSPQHPMSEMQRLISTAQERVRVLTAALDCAPKPATWTKTKRHDALGYSLEPLDKLYNEWYDTTRAQVLKP